MVFQYSRHLAGLLVLGGIAACGAGTQPAVPAPVRTQADPRAFQEFVRALDNTLVEVNELERMGGGIRDRMLLVDAQSLIKPNEGFALYDALNANYGKIRILRSSMETNEGVQEVMLRAGKHLTDLVAIDAKQGGVVIIYYRDN